MEYTPPLDSYDIIISNESNLKMDLIHDINILQLQCKTAYNRSKYIWILTKPHNRRSFIAPIYHYYNQWWAKKHGYYVFLNMTVKQHIKLKTTIICIISHKSEIQRKNKMSCRRNTEILLFIQLLWYFNLNWYISPKVKKM